jgi:hypothetical protein
LIWLFKFIPETKEKSFGDIYNDFAGLNGVSKKEDEQNSSSSIEKQPLKEETQNEKRKKFRIFLKLEFRSHTH